MKKMIATMAILLSTAAVAHNHQVLSNPPLQYAEEMTHLKTTKGIDFSIKTISWGETIVGRQLFASAHQDDSKVCATISFPIKKNILSELFETDFAMFLESGTHEYLGTYWAKEINKPSHLRIHVDLKDMNDCL